MTTKVTNIYNLKLTPSQFGQNSIVVNCSQYDSLFRVIQFNLFNGNAVYSIPEGSVVTIRGTKKDNTGFEYECDYSNNVVTFPLQQQITIFPGKVPAELRITSNGEIIGSWNFLFLVEESPLTNDTIISETQLPLLESALQAASEAENYKNLAQASADNASESEQNASESEANALTYSQNAQTSANSVSQSEANALTYSQNASESASEAQGFAQDAEDSATQSADSATQASQSATQAQTIADNIADLVDEAQGYASQSATNAQNSAQSASQASQSATNASQSASNAQTYASNANTSAQNASSSATSAQTYAGNASTSATQSASSATQSAQSATNAQTYANNASASATQAQGYATNASDSATASADSATESQGYAQNASDSASEAQELVDTVEERIENKADKDGVYPKLVAGDLVESETKDDVFTYQVTDHTGKANINSIKGNTLVWNQLVDTNTSSVTLTSGHKFITKVSGTYSLVNGTGQSLSVTGGTDEVFDLTKMGLASITSVDEFKALYPLPIYSVDTGSLLSFNGTGIKTVGFNQWDEEWEDGSITSSGVLQPISSSIRSKNFCPCLPNTTYYLRMIEGSTGQAICWYDSAKNFIIRVTDQETRNAISPSNASYFKLSLYNYKIQDYVTYNNDVCLNISDTLKNGTYEPYTSSTLSLPISTYFPTGMKSAGSVYDELTPSKAITRVGSRAYQSGDESDTTVNTDGTTTYYALTTPIETDVDLDLSYNTYEGGTEQLLPANTDVPATSPISMNVEFDFGENLNARFNKVLSMIAPVESLQVSKAYSVGQYLIYDYTLYRVTSNITSGGTIKIGTNVTATTLAEILESL